MTFKNTLSQFAVGASLLVTSSMALAIGETESNDTFATANATGGGVNAASGIIGDLSAASNDVDIWTFNLTAGAGVGVSITNGSGTDFNAFDPVIVLYREQAGSYYAVAGNNPNAFTTSFGFTPWASGNYFLTVSAFNNVPQDGLNNNQFESAVWTSESQLFTPFDHFSNGSFNSFDYNLSLTGTVGAPVPVPAAVWLFGSGLLGLAGIARRRR